MSRGACTLLTGPSPTGAFDFEALSVPAIGRMFRYAAVGTTPEGRRIWQQQPDDYAIGFPPEYNNGNGGVAIGYNYDRNGVLEPSSCGGFLWATGENLRQTPDKFLKAELGRSGPLDVDGLQGNGTWRIRPDNAPPRQSYFIDYDDDYADASARGHMGDIAIERLCSAAQHATQCRCQLPALLRARRPLESRPVRRHPPPGTCPPGQLRRAGTNECGSCARPNVQVGGVCCSVAQLAANAACSNSSCPPGQTTIGPSNFCCNSSLVYTGAGGAPACCSSPLVNGQCPTPTPPSNPACQPGYVPVGGTCCLASKVTSTGVCCPAGQAPAGPQKNWCEPIVLVPIGPQCCQSGIPTASGTCCPPANVTTSGVCCPGPVDPNNRSECKAPVQHAGCAPGYKKMPDGSCCNSRFVSDDGKSCRVARTSPPLVPLVPLKPRACPPGMVRDRNSDCVGFGPRTCGPGRIRLPNGACILRSRLPCPPGMVRTPRGFCIRVGPLRRFGPRPFGPIIAPRPGLVR